jgi:hypothetical protein
LPRPAHHVTKSPLKSATDDMLSFRLFFVQTDIILIISTTVFNNFLKMFPVRLNCSHQNGLIKQVWKPGG